MDSHASVYLTEAMFSGQERPLLSMEGLQVAALRYASGVAALRVTTGRSEVVVLPFRGQQVWRYTVDGEPLTMHTHFDEPATSTAFGETYGGFLLHCGLSGLGAPGPGDTHPHHGELPNGTFAEARLLVGDGWVGITGTYRHRVSHGADVSFTPTLIIRAGETGLDLAIEITNHRKDPFGYSYLCHVNWPIFEGGRLIEAVAHDPEHFELAPHPAQDDATAEYLERIAADPSMGEELDPARLIVPEYCAILSPQADSDGWAHFLQTRPDGRSASVSYQTEHLPYVIRWISNTGDESAAGFCLPATSHHKGRAAAQRDGMVRWIPGGAVIRMNLTVDFLDREATQSRIRLIESYAAR